MTVVVSGCGQGADGNGHGASPGASQRSPATSVAADGVYKVGVDIAPGVYTTPYSGCVGYTASDRHARPRGPGSSGTLLARAIRVEQVQRIVVHDGDFFTTRRCGTWHRENPGDPKSPDPATLAGGCEILLQGYELVDHVLWFLRTPTSAQVASNFQDMLRAPVQAHNKLLAGPTNHLIDALKDPPRHVTAGGDVTPDIDRAVAAIRHACAGS
jgi:hypothetical protein